MPTDASRPGSVSLDEIAPTRRPGGRLSLKLAVGAAAVLLVAGGLTVAAVAGPSDDTEVGSGVALVSDSTPTTTTPTAAPTTAPPTTVPAPEAEAVPTGDCSDPAMCGDISSEGPCDDASMCGEIRADEECADSQMCGDIPAPSDCADPAMCGEIVPAPDPGGGG